LKIYSTSSDLLEASINISSMSEETTASISEVSNSIQEVANVATMDELTQYADNLQEISRKLQGELTNFNLK